jgi:hypothetical protein
MRLFDSRLLHIVGGTLGLLGVVFVSARLYSYADQIDLSRFNLIAWSIITLLALAYGFANILLVRAWWHLLAFFEVKAGWKWAIKVYGLSQLAKYVPGNIFHLASRQALGMAAGLSARSLAKSAVWELGSIAVAGVLFGIIAVPLVWPNLSLWMVSALFVVMAAMLFAATRRLLSPSVAAALVWQIAFLVVSGLVFIGTLALVVPAATILPFFPALCGAYVIAWLAGFVTPGAPAGVGIREMVLLFLLGGLIGQADLLLAVVIGRLVTVTGDLFYFVIATQLKQSGIIYE